MSGADQGERYDVLVVGAGPAGMAAATDAAALGLSTVVVDEQPSPGGQIYRAVTESPLRDDPRAAALGASYWRGGELARDFAASGATYLPGATVWSVSSDVDGLREVAVSVADRSRLLRAAAVVLATGAQERPAPISGWTLPGVMTAGAAQILLKTSALVPVGRVVLAGSGPLLWLLAAQLARLGAAPSTILDTTPPAAVTLWRDALAFAGSTYLGEGLALMRAVRARAGRPIRATTLAVDGAVKVEGVRYRDASGRERRIEADTVLLHQGVVPNTNLARSIGCAHVWNEDNACFDAEVDPWGATSRPGVWIAGDGAGIAGAAAAAERGRLAALDVAHRLGRIDTATRDRRATAPRAALARATRGRRFLDRYFRPSEAFRAPDGDVVVCRCEEVRAADIVAAAAAGGTGPNQLKAYLRCGMGPCQGRMCGLTVTELTARARGLAPSEIGYYRLRAPVKPIRVAELAAMPRSPAETEAVDRG